MYSIAAKGINNHQPDLNPNHSLLGISNFNTRHLGNMIQPKSALSKACQFSVQQSRTINTGV